MPKDEKANILIVDDSPSKLLAMSAALADLNQNVVTALSSREALRYMLNDEFAVVLLDVNMPEMDGFETAALIRARKRSAHVPIIFITAYGDDTTASQGYSLGAVDYLLTPVVPEILRAKVSVFVELFRKNLQIQQQAEQRIALADEQAARRTAEAANRMKDEFLATLSHELRTPLNAILGWVQLLQMGHHTEEDLANGLEVIERNAKVQAKIIEDLLDVSRIISGKLQLELRLANAIDSVESALAAIQLDLESKELHLYRDFDDNLPLVNVDPTRLQQVVWNLLVNAVKFTPSGGRVGVEVHSHGNELEISVVDTGDGIAPEFLPYVFERFRQADASTTRRHGGLGIGLGIVRQVIDLHGGRVGVESPGLGKGARFSILLPLPKEAATSGQPSPPEPRAVVQDGTCHSLTGARVLVVDDQQDARELLKRILSECDADVVDAANASDALALIANYHPTILVSDIGMPEKDGYELIREVRTRLNASELPAIALTAYARPEERGRALTAGYQVHISKPVNSSELTAAIANLMGRRNCLTDGANGNGAAAPVQS